MFRILGGKKYLVLFFIITGLLSLSACDGITPDFDGSIDIKSTPSGATVYLDGIDTGKITPIVLTDVPSGTHTVKIELYLHKSKEDTNVMVTAGDTKYLNWNLTPVTVKTLNLQPGSEGKDSNVSEGAPDSNSGNNIVLVVGYIPSNPRFRTYLYFDVSSSLPIDAAIVSAYLNLHQQNFHGTGTLSISLYLVNSDWEENTITWNNQPNSSSEEEYRSNVSYSTDTWIFWHIRDLVKGWLDGSITNYGILLKPVPEPATGLAWFHSSDFSNISLRPKLVISYYVP